ncbi:hypothetical protein AZ78_1728 [Lysobacter capsici AZ78]|uniref:Uncharacterized protein n=1 Tax=Lysobacter capsici AZ78 TaxID=1444315 RepID=A0A108U7W6_9GAMM|nr:hypothetical protein [Lysobacter capsici]KWS04179.1 hypothetical protein AZ78_1728 [Lysobacter capsici AZ78]
MGDGAPVAIALSDGQLRAWVEQDNAIHIKALSGAGDPVELSDRDVAALVDFLQAYLRGAG